MNGIRYSGNQENHNVSYSLKHKPVDLPKDLFIFMNDNKDELEVENIERHIVENAIKMHKTELEIIKSVENGQYNYYMEHLLEIIGGLSEEFFEEHIKDFEIFIRSYALSNKEHIDVLTAKNLLLLLHLWTFKTPIFQHKKLNDLYQEFIYPKIDIEVCKINLYTTFFLT